MSNRVIQTLFNNDDNSKLSSLLSSSNDDYMKVRLHLISIRQPPNRLPDYRCSSNCSISVSEHFDKKTWNDRRNTRPRVRTNIITSHKDHCHKKRQATTVGPWLHLDSEGSVNSRIHAVHATIVALEEHKEFNGASNNFAARVRPVE